MELQQQHQTEYTHYNSGAVEEMAKLRRCVQVDEESAARATEREKEMELTECRVEST